jgi:hypothetical protein
MLELLGTMLELLGVLLLELGTTEELLGCGGGSTSDEQEKNSETSKKPAANKGRIATLALMSDFLIVYLHC